MSGTGATPFTLRASVPVRTDVLDLEEVEHIRPDHEYQQTLAEAERIGWKNLEIEGDRRFSISSTKGNPDDATEPHVIDVIINDMGWNASVPVLQQQPHQEQQQPMQQMHEQQQQPEPGVGGESTATNPTRARRPHTPLADWDLTYSGSTHFSARGRLSVVAANEYGSFSAEGLALYGFDMVVEPYRRTTLTALCDGAACTGALQWLVVEADEKGGGAKAGAAPLFDGEAASVQITFEAPGTFFFIRAEMDASAAAGASSLAEPGAAAERWGWESARVACKYQRRELRQLTSADREIFLSALEAVYRAPSLEAGRQLYGEAFVDYATLAAMHNSQAFCYHDGLQFLTSHWAFNMMLERSLQSVNRQAALHYWDFMVEADTLGSGWPASEVFSDTWFGDAVGDAASDFQILNGRFSGVRQLFDPEYTLVDPVLEVEHNAYGFVNTGTNSQALPFVTRTHSFCGMPGNASFVDCGVFVYCFENKNDLSGWTSCLERSVHMNMHGLLGGAWNCQVDFAAWQAAHPDVGTALLTVALEYITANRWGGNTYPAFADNNVCPAADACVGVKDEVGVFKGLTAAPAGAAAAAAPVDAAAVAGLAGNAADVMLIGTRMATRALPERAAAAEPSKAAAGCSCACTLDIDSVSDSEVYSMMADLLESMANQNEAFVAMDEDGRYVFQQDDVPLAADTNAALLRALLAVGCTPGRVGLMATGASPLDPIFWVLHPLFEKALQPLRLAERWRSQYSFEWVDGDCYGSGATDEQPFTERMLGISGSGGSSSRGSDDFLRNIDLLGLADPTAAALPYVYDGFEQWGTCAWSAL